MTMGTFTRSFITMTIDGGVKRMNSIITYKGHAVPVILHEYTVIS